MLVFVFLSLNTVLSQIPSLPSYPFKNHFDLRLSMSISIP